MAPCHNLSLKESCEVCAEYSTYRIGESLTKKQINKYAQVSQTDYGGNNGALDGNSDVMIAYIPNSMKTNPPCNFPIRNSSQFL